MPGAGVNRANTSEGAHSIVLMELVDRWQMCFFWSLFLPAPRRQTWSANHIELIQDITRIELCCLVELLLFIIYCLVKGRRTICLQFKAIGVERMMLINFTDEGTVLLTDQTREIDKAVATSDTEEVGHGCLLLLLIPLWLSIDFWWRATDTHQYYVLRSYFMLPLYCCIDQILITCQPVEAPKEKTN